MDFARGKGEFRAKIFILCQPTCPSLRTFDTQRKTRYALLITFGEPK